MRSMREGYQINRRRAEAFEETLTHSALVSPDGAGGVGTSGSLILSR